MLRLLFSLLLVPAMVAVGRGAAAEPAAGASSSATSTPTSTPAASGTTDPSYRLTSGDTISVSVFGEPDLLVTQIIDHAGGVRLALIGEIVLSGKSVREAERAIEAAYSQRQFLRAPVVSLSVTAYVPREVSVLGAVRSPGTLAFPRDVTSLDIVEVITRVGGFLPVSKSDAVSVTHRTADGKETVTNVDLENIISGRRQAGRDRADFAIYPGDRIWVPERLF